MRTARFRDPAGTVRTGEWTDDGLLAAGETYDVDAVEFLPPVSPSKIVCVGLNYADHAAESGNEVPDRPLLFLKPPNTLSAHGDTVTLPTGPDRIDHEAELGVVIGQQCRNVDAADAADAIAGYTCVNDLSNRDDQRREQNWVRGKAFDNAAPIGPVVADPDLVPDDATIECRVNGETRQSSSIDALSFSPAELIAEVTDLITLEPGDVIATGTPAGVSPLADGDEVVVEIEGIGALETTVRR
ncbi:fumarylacetoacetate hydrolase family protein [Halopenitus persicus]|uniref:2-keto-4-pentenoate hydratase/2-oxohepta-3-ene-1,7-dioic acid hydratase (Catechol pathway) n=1 Tax=Halopenitus persicus TaxID=1048396 RepID=A0A1H3FM25_9EURY|nr:fumarylacetoacetate hydrolase family protein [Halopenitus persicus]SDX92102.1 2-keto-4-pentenoate hydratase/2-oxohepta-3-ene-1,7-dioic acid hydratase (catechol pathway) [Halopenitus persicus]